MTAEKALEIIDIAIAEVEWEYPLEYAVAFEMAKKALEKQMPKRPKDIHCIKSVIKIGACSCCGEGANDAMMFCANCGQAIDWSDEE